jgi:hypothetical protein
MTRRLPVKTATEPTRETGSSGLVSRLWPAMAALLLATAFVLPAPATTMLQLNLEDLVVRAERIYRGTVVKIEAGSKEIGGGEIPTLTYTIRVDEPFKGSFEVRKGQQMEILTTFGKQPPVTVGKSRRLVSLLGMPQMEVGGTYLLFATRRSAVGLSAPVGLGQGCFRVLPKNGGETAENEFANTGLFRGLEVSGPEAEAPLAYDRLAAEIRTAVERLREAQP